MLDSYFEEVRAKRRKKTLFWLIVLIFAIILFFFFKGKYISLNVNWDKLLSGSGNILEENSLTGSIKNGSWSTNSFISLHSFGIVNVKISPKDGYMSLNGNPYISDSKPQVDYWTYLLEFDWEGYLSGATNFEINDERNFYIDNIALLKKPEYKKFQKISNPQIVAIGDDYWINSTASGMILYQENFQTGAIINKKNLVHIGGGKFLSGKILTEFDPINRTWSESGFHPIVSNFVRTCANPIFKNQVYYCGDNSIMTPSGNSFSGFVDSGKNFIKYSNKILLGNIAENNYKSFPLSAFSASGTELSSHFINISGDWYNVHSRQNEITTGSGLIFERMDGEILEKNPLEINLDSLDAILETGDKDFFIGEKSGSGKVLAIADKKWLDEEIRYLDFPDIDISEARIYEKNRNYFIKTKNSLLFLYREGNEVKWLIDGKILAIWKDFALYEKEDGIWIADWKDKKLEK